MVGRLICILGSLAMGAAGSPPIVGVNTGGWLLIEEWMFSFGIFDGVGESEDQPQVAIIPQALPLALEARPPISTH